MAATVSSTNPASLIVSVWMATWTSKSSATFRQASIAAGVVPQSSCSFSPHAPASICSTSGARCGAVSLPQKSEIHGPRFGGLQHAREIPCARRAGGGGGAGGRTGAAADHGGDAVRERFVNLLRRDEVDVAIDAAGGDDQIFSGDHFGGRRRRPAPDQRRPSCRDFRLCPLSRCGRRGCRCRLSRCPSDRGSPRW